MAGSGGQLLTTMLILLATIVSVLPQNCPITMLIEPIETSSLECPGELTNGQEYQIPSMECALEMIARSNFFTNESLKVCIQLTAGEHTILYSDRIIFSDIAISGNGSDVVTLTCSDDYSLSQDSYTEFPIHISGQATVEIEGVSFSGCARPLLFNGTENVTLEDCSFR